MEAGGSGWVVIELEIGQIITNRASLAACTTVRINSGDGGNGRAIAAFEISHFARALVNRSEAW